MGTENTTVEFEKHARSLRRRIVRLIHDSGTAGHYGGSLSCVEILTCLYFGWMRHRPADPEWDERDRLVLSKGGFLFQTGSHLTGSFLVRISLDSSLDTITVTIFHVPVFGLLFYLLSVDGLVVFLLEYRRHIFIPSFVR